MAEEKVESTEKKDVNGSGISGYATLTLRDAKTGAIKQQVTTKNTILARGLDYIISHIVSGNFQGSTLTEGNASQYHGQVSSTNYIVGSPETNPFKCLNLLYIADSNDLTPDFSEGRGNTSYYLHKNTGTDGLTGVDVVTYDEKLGDSGSQSSSSHSFSGSEAQSPIRNKILGSALLTDNTRFNSGSNQSNEDASVLKFEKVYLVFNFGVNDANAVTGEGINSICWSSDANALCVGARLVVSPMISKTSADTLDITYTFDLTVT